MDVRVGSPAIVGEARKRFEQWLELARGALQTRRGAIALSCAAILAAGLAVFSGVVDHDFVRWDDPMHFMGNPGLNPASLGSLKQFWLSAYRGLYIPVAYSFLWVLTWLSPQHSAAGSPAVFHAANLALHLSNTLLLFG